MDARKSSFVLRRVKQGGSTEFVSEHPDFGSGWSAGQHAVNVTKDAYSLYENGRRIAKFGHARLMPRRSSFDWSILNVR